MMAYAMTTLRKHNLPIHVIALLSTSNWKFSETGGTVYLLYCALSLKTLSDPSLHKGMIREKDD